MTPALREVAEHIIRMLTGREKTFCTVQAPPIRLGSPPKMDFLGQYSTLAVFLATVLYCPPKNNVFPVLEASSPGLQKDWVVWCCTALLARKL